MSLALAAAWPHASGGVRPVVVEADVSGGDLATRFALSDAAGLMALAAGARRGSPEKELDACVQDVPGGLRAVVAPAGAEQAAASVAEVAACVEVLRGDEDTEGVVVLDLGRLVDGPTRDLARAADGLVLVCAGRVDALVHAAVRGSWLEGAPFEVVVMGACDYPQVEIAEALKMRRDRIHLVGFDARASAALDGRGQVGRRRWRRSALTAGASALAVRLGQQRTDGPELEATGELAQIAGRVGPKAIEGGWDLHSEPTGGAT
ncbi:hypothetical protein H9Y04_36310 [Streptomyces sp. TRM66268-LWL]|uniref:Uncharacterized protein n=1 Tax=Streptomyces polyasparticus TaxID=2767826 RepID=A0ABR7SR76_9ACTN|nr:hypothetical protein [Streptomyces polyasparticus]MBC9718011.1 hypothetical protein [Streptomyces polyasparticus]